MFVIGIDPHKGSHTAAVLDDTERFVGQLRVNADRWQRDRLLRFAGRRSGMPISAPRARTIGRTPSRPTPRGRTGTTWASGSREACNLGVTGTSAMSGPTSVMIWPCQRSRASESWGGNGEAVGASSFTGERQPVAW